MPRLRPSSKRFLFILAALAGSTAFAVVVAEIGLRLYAESCVRDVPDYANTWRRTQEPSDLMGPGGYLKEDFEAQVIDGYGGTVRWKNNSQGFRSERDFSSQPSAGVLRILSLGDSFTAGYRVDQQDTFSRRLEVWSGKEFGPNEVLVSCIEHPLDALHYLGRFGERWSPQVVLLGVTLGNDIGQTHGDLHPEDLGKMFGPQGMKLPDYSTGGPVHSPSFWQRSRFLRLLAGPRHGVAHGAGPQVLFFDMGHNLGLCLRRLPPPAQAAYASFFEVLEDIDRWCRARQILFAALLFPSRFQVQPVDWQAAVRDLALKEDEFDIMLPNRKILDFCRRREIRCLDPTPGMRRIYQQTGAEQYLPELDMHWNAEGHRAFLESVKQDLAPILSEVQQRRALMRP